MTTRVPDRLQVDAVIIGGGFYGSAIAIYLAKQRGMKRVALIERESNLLSRASYNNQARVHNGYHYPRSFTTAYRSKINFPHFVRDWPQAIKRDFTKVYAISRRNSKVTAKQFERFCREIDVKLEPADISVRQLFEPQLIEAAFLAEEYAFDAEKLARWAQEEMHQCGIQVYLNTSATGIAKDGAHGLQVRTTSVDEKQRIDCRYVFNCTYSGLNQLDDDYQGTRTRLKHEITEMALINVSPALAGLGITVMDGPFFSMMPFPPRGLHTLSHVRYTPHLHWEDRFGIDPYQKLAAYPCETRAERMIRDAARYLPVLRESTYVDSLFEVKTVLVKNESDDGRPILFERHAGLPGCYSVLGGKIDNIYDILEKIESEELAC